ncbi:thiamine transporter 1-like isoform X1 [Tigriopus californicus]|uniref:thiamine transporter 1-like isoform X1 n=1 Tax=Tigriopus californicus TaxID=6832 RepID=UPI0027D9E34A|nr:thiamine transporter 1-like isoform X1 [Tigriopus californicus]
MALKHYVGTLLILCLFGFFKELKPSEPYLTEYLTGFEYKNLTKDDVYQKVYPVWSYAYFFVLIPVFLLTDLVRYKPMIMFEGLVYVVTWVLLLWAEGVVAMQVMQFIYGMATASEVAYYTYIYAKVPKTDYMRVSSLTRFSILMGKFVSGLLSQLLDTFDVVDYRELNYISLGGVSTAFILCIFLPSIKTSIYFHHKDPDNDTLQEPNGHKDRGLCFRASQLLWNHAKDSYRQNYVIKWSIWVAASTCLNFQIGNYIQPLWQEIQVDQEDSELFNGGVEAVTTLLGALIVALVGLVKFNWSKSGDYAILLISVLGAIVLAVMSQTQSIWVAYVGYILIRMSYQLLMTVASFELASHIPNDSSGLVFGLNTWVALGLQSLLTLAVADSVGLALPIRDQFVVYASLYGLVGVFFASYFLLKAYCDMKR